ncbi:dihydroxyacetone kinase subunit L [Pelagibacterium luteolum]|uniref:Dihydroxyacetone kinase, C-terminal domain n=1 Tax=Pelagibacterium luteolum TaxID=440168 RepID=A0A1G7RXI7_9HYPH|nr:dihydroxyacetone kinase subunit L [Pelagibacterium luteolum]SDG15476.1 dihydroxyacetone kinase, C-terminal domain [Pelagibacterium luteolum]
MGFSSHDIGAAIALLAVKLPDLEQDLNRADAKLGDGDTGTMLARVISALASVTPPGNDVGAAFSAYGRATAMATGSSLGTLIATAFLTAAKATKGRESVAWSEISPLLADARDAMLARGGASLGDKTVLDGLDAVAAATQDVEDPEALGKSAATAARWALDSFRDKPNKIGRARMFADGSKGLDDPGMLALVRVIEIIGER